MNSLFLISAVFASSVAAFATTNEPVTCRRTAVQVALAPQTPANYTVSGELCAIPMERTAGATVQLLIPQPTTMNTGTSEKSTETSTRMHYFGAGHALTAISSAVRI